MASVAILDLAIWQKNNNPRISGRTWGIQRSQITHQNILSRELSWNWRYSYQIPVISFWHHQIHHCLLTRTVCDVLYGISVILDHENIGVDITFSVLSCLVQEIWCKLHNSLMAEIKWLPQGIFVMAQFQKMSRAPNYKRTKFHAYMNKWTSFSHIIWANRQKLGFCHYGGRLVYRVITINKLPDWQGYHTKI